MSILDTVKRVAGDHGVVAVIPRVRSAKHVELELEVRADKPATINAHRFDVFVERGDLRVCAGYTVHDAKSKIIEGKPSWPYSIEPGQVATDRAEITELDIKKAVEELGPGTEPRYLVKATLDVDGTLVPAGAEAYFTL